MSLIARKPTKKFDNNFSRTSVLGFVLPSNYKATVLWGMLIVAFPRRLKFINPEFPSVLRQIPECVWGREEMPDKGLNKGRESKAALAPTSNPLVQLGPISLATARTQQICAFLSHTCDGVPLKTDRASLPSLSS